VRQATFDWVASAHTRHRGVSHTSERLKSHLKSLSPSACLRAPLRRYPTPFWDACPALAKVAMHCATPCYGRSGGLPRRAGGGRQEPGVGVAAGSGR